MEEYKISLGAEISQQGLGNVKDQIKTLESNPIKLTLDKNLSNEIKAIKEQIDSLGSSKGKNKNALAINTDSVEKSLNDIAVTIKEVRDALGTIDNKSGMKSLLSSINQITASLGKASDETQTLVSSLNALSKKDFNFNFGFNMGKSASQLSSEQGDLKRNAISQLKQQAKALEDYFDQYYKVAQQGAGVAKLTQGTNVFRDYWELSPNIGNTKASLKQQVSTYKQYIDLMQQAAKIKGVDLSGVVSGFSKTTDDIVKETKSATNSVEQFSQALKGLFGGGIDSESLTQILTDLNEINTAIKTLASDTSLGGLTQSFDNLSNTLKEITRDISTFAQAVNSGVSGAVDGIKKISNSGNSSDSFVDKEVLNMMKELGVAGGKGSEAFREIKSAMLEYIAVAERAGNETGEVVNELAMLERSNAMSKVRDTALNYGATQSKKKELKEQQKLYKDFYADIRKTNKNGTKIFIPADVQAELPKNITRSLGSAFITKDRAGSMELDSWLKDLSERFPYVVDRTKDLAGQLMDVFQKLEIAKGRFSDASVDGAFSDNEIRNAENVIENAANNIVNSQQRIQDASSASADSIEQDENRKQQAYQKTLEKLKRVNDEINNSEHKKKLDEIDEQFESLYDADSGFTKDEADAAKQPLIDSYWSGQEDELARYNALLEERARLENELKNIKSVTVSSGEDGFKEMSADVDTLGGKLADLQDKLKSVGFNEASVESLTNEFKELGITVSSVHSKLGDDGNLTLTVKGIDDAREAVTVVGRLKKDADNIELDITVDDSQVNSTLKKIQEKLRTSSNTALDSDYHKQISKLESDFGKLTIQSDELKDRINGLKVILGQMYETNDAQKLISLNEQLEQSLKSVGNQIQINAKSAEEAAAKQAKALAEKAKGIEFKAADGGKYSEEVRKLETRFDNLSTKTNESTIAINKLKQSLKDMQNASSVDERIEAEKRYQVALQQTKSSLDRLEQAQKTSIDSAKLRQDATNLSLDMGNWLRDNSAAAKQFGSQIRSLQSELKSCDGVRFDGIKGEFKQIKAEAKSLGLTTQTLSDRLKTQFQKYSAYFGVAELFMYAEQGLRDMFEQVKLIDSAMTELRKVTDETDASYNKFLSNAAERAKVIGTTIDGLVDSTAEFAKIGYSFTDSQGLAEVANIYTVVGDNIESAEDATKSLISTMAAFKDEMNGMDNTDFAMSIVDKFNQVANEYSIGSGGLGEALTRSASSLAAANNSLDESLALITAANEVVQDEARVGNAMKTISMRIRGAKTELDAAGESTEGMAESTASLRAEIMALSGVDIMLNADTFKSTYQIMEELSYKWEDLSDIAQASITELLAGGGTLAGIYRNIYRRIYLTALVA